jgi:RecB family endonuclease NucS
MQSYVEKYPWLLEIAYAPLEREPQLQRLLEENFGVHPDPEDPDLGRYPDFVVLAYGSEIVVLELKRPGRSGNRDHYRQLEDYVHFMRRYVERTTDPNLGQRVTGYLICSGLTPEARQLADTGAANRIYVVDWDRLVTRAYQLHREFFKVMAGRAPADDPAVEQLKRVDEELQESIQ